LAVVPLSGFARHGVEYVEACPVDGAWSTGIQWKQRFVGVAWPSHRIGGEDAGDLRESRLHVTKKAAV
jgi:hypothetical protein